MRLHQGRIPINPPACPKGIEVLPVDVVSLVNGTGEKLPSSPLNPFDPFQIAFSQPNYCQYNDELMAPDPRIIRFENPYFVIGLELPREHLIPPDLFAMSFTIVGGSQPAVLALGVDIPASQPRSTVVTPDGQTFLVVDEGKSTVATGLRGQLLRILSSPPGNDRLFIVR